MLIQLVEGKNVPNWNCATSSFDSCLAKEARPPVEAPGPELSNSPKITFPVLGSDLVHAVQPTAAIEALSSDWI